MFEIGLVVANKSQLQDGSIIRCYRQRHWRWIGHTLCKPVDSISRQASAWNPARKSKGGQSSNTWRRDLEADVKETGYNRRPLEILAQDRIAWRNHVGGLCPRRCDERFDWFTESHIIAISAYPKAAGNVISGQEGEDNVGLSGKCWSYWLEEQILRRRRRMTTMVSSHFSCFRVLLNKSMKRANMTINTGLRISINLVFHVFIFAVSICFIANMKNIVYKVKRKKTHQLALLSETQRHWNYKASRITFWHYFSAQAGNGHQRKCTLEMFF